MQRRLVQVAISTMVIVFMHTATFAQVGIDAQVEAAIKDYLAHRSETYLEVYAKVSQLGADALATLLKLSAKQNTSEGLAARKIAEAIVHTASAKGAEERSKVTRALIDALKLDLPVEAKQFAVDLLGYSGTDDAIDALAKLLDDEALRENARRALERIPNEAAAKAIVNALPRSTGRFKAGLINTLGMKRFMGAVDPIAEALKDKDELVRMAAIEALGRIPSMRCEPLLKEVIAQARSDREKRIALDSYLRLADGLTTLGETKLAGEMYLWVYRESGDASARRAALAGLPKALTAQGVKVLIEALKDEDAQLRLIAASSLAELGGAEVTKAMCEALKAADGEMRILIVDLLGRRRDKAATDSLIELLKVEEEALQVAIANALSALNDERAIQPLIQLCMRGGRASEAASQALSTITEGKVADAILQALPNAVGDAKIQLLRSLGPHKTDASTKALIEAARDADERIAVAALQALSVQRPLEAVPLLEELSEKGKDAVKRAALQAYIRTADYIRKRDEAKALQMYHYAARVAIHDDERRMALYGIASIGDPSSLPIVEELQKISALWQQCAEAYAAIADRLAHKREAEDKAIALYKRALLLTRDRRLIDDVADKMRSFGFSPSDVASERGYITRWWFLGPVKGREEWRDADAVDVKAVNIAKPVKLEQGILRWRYQRIDNPMGHVDLEQLVSRQDFVCAYMYAEFELDKPIEATMLIGSDDDIIVWLNGEVVHKFIGDRGWSADQDKANVKLREGMNTLLLKVLNGRAQWAASVRFAGADGDPINIDAHIAKRSIEQLRKVGFITNWHLLGPFIGRDALRTKDIITPDIVDVNAQIVVEGRTYRWMPYRLENPNGVIDLLVAVARQNNCGAYAYAEVICEEEKEAILSVGSDDDIVIWLNGELVHRNIVDRACAPDQDRVKVKLRAGVNRILCKVLNGGGDWGLSARLTDTNGNPLSFRQP
ncbi:MAG: HEAT repeat domain-containing protein [Armatimonadota bacterium]|nr:HEAT repeat domain-containing protein [Armatimonadota bacterium]MCX7778364.1 HEAT repeat domain-containing protein [Armatimonadota bacterium]MDW8026421.1 HEAT repeat domain-containing protein [Armatimonadota bacterium]